ncbi:MULTISPECIES: circularly permuted type 2 ATP-grasp protein [Paenibacillus]|uniref:Circularly permuted ATP-grasp type 2 domain-containing protein n=1 Tax=Paenibacillus aceti TaxID=1820010 RepID=A0ABQ1W8F8_9BACL|nr:MULTISPECIES: circularly permuted type 2 ATP-grasp protein [Paenibacillus]GGG20270.1 hypothetical protein GCM10010913_48090 [Paenibacillus aceti]
MSTYETLTSALSENEIFKVQYKQVLKNINDLGISKFCKLIDLADQELKNNSVQFLLGYGSNFYFPEPTDERYIPVDWIPKILTSDQFSLLEKGIEQRAKTFNLFLNDYYNGRSSIVPDEIINTSKFLCEENKSLKFKYQVYTHLYGIDMVTCDTGETYVLEDNLGLPAGIGYPQILRSISKKVIPELFDGYRISDINMYSLDLYRALASLSDVDNPVIVYVQRGPGAVDHFESRLLAQHTNIILADPEDLHYENNSEIYLKLSNGKLMKIDVIYLRLTERFKDVFDLMSRALVTGKTAIVTFRGNMLPADKAIFAYIPKLIKYYLNEEAILKQPETYWLGEEEHLKWALENIDKYVIKSRSGVGGKQVLIGPEASKEKIEEWKEIIISNPKEYIAQEVINFNQFVKWDKEKDVLSPVFSDLRMFGTIDRDNSVKVMKGGSCRCSSPSSRIVNMSSGGKVKDIWVQEP